MIHPTNKRERIAIAQKKRSRRKDPEGHVKKTLLKEALKERESKDAVLTEGFPGAG